MGSPFASRSMAPPCGGAVFAGDAGGGQRSRVGDGDVSVDPVKKSRMARRNFVEILAGGQGLLRPKRVIPVAAREPVPGGCGIGEALDFNEHRRQGFNAGQVHVELGSAGASQVGVSVIEAGEDEGLAGRRLQGREGGCVAPPAG